MIKFNDTLPPQQPTELDEAPDFVQTDTTAIDGSIERNQGDSKAKAVLTYSFAKPATLQYFKALYDSASDVAYHNDQSNQSNGVLEFTGLIDYAPGAYEKGGTLGVSLTVTIREK